MPDRQPLHRLRMGMGCWLLLLPLLLLLLLLLAGCTTSGKATTRLPQQLFSTQFSPGSDSAEIQQQVQKIRIQHGTFSAELLGILEVSTSRTTLVVLTATGMMLFSIYQTSNETKVERHADIPDYVEPRQILSDVRLLNWPSKLLHTALLPDVELNESQQERHLLKHQKIYLSAWFAPNRFDWRTATLNNHQYNYSLHVTPLTSGIER